MLEHARTWEDGGDHGEGHMLATGAWSDGTPCTTNLIDVLLGHRCLACRVERVGVTHLIGWESLVIGLGFENLQDIGYHLVWHSKGFNRFSRFQLG